jgi:hypothetical protein
MSLDPHEEPAAIQTHIGAIFISLELSRSKWLITSLVPGGGQKRDCLKIGGQAAFGTGADESLAGWNFCP